MLKLGDKIVRGDIVNGFVKKNTIARDYRVIGVNPNLILQEVVIINGFEELKEKTKFDWNIKNKLRLMFPNNHIVHSLFGGDWSHVWVGNF